jgi:hypothetical protein
MLSRNQIMDFVKDALLKAPIRFEEAANSSLRKVDWKADRMPESWILSEVMNAARQIGIAAIPEVRANHDFQHCDGSANSFSTIAAALSGMKIDLFLGELGSNPEKMLVRAALEIKGPKSTWNAFRSDIARLKILSTCLNGENDITIFAYVTPPLTEVELRNEELRFREETRLPRKKYAVLRAVKPSRREGCYCYLFISPVS